MRTSLLQSAIQKMERTVVYEYARQLTLFEYILKSVCPNSSLENLQKGQSIVLSKYSRYCAGALLWAIL